MTGRRVLVAGATGQLGQVIARDLAHEGYRVAVHCRSARAVAEQIIESFPRSEEHAVIQVDLGDLEAVDAAIADLEARWGSVDDLVNAAWPAVPSGALTTYDQAGLDAAVLGFRCHAHLSRAVIPGLRRSGGSIVFLGGALSSRFHQGLGLFSAGKAAATALTHVIALEEGSFGVRANVISPGRVAVSEGDLAEEDLAFATLDEIGALRRVLPLPSMEEVASTVRWLLAPESSAITGQTISLAGGERV